MTLSAPVEWHPRSTSSISVVVLSFRPARPEEANELADLASRTFPLACPEDLPREAIDEFIRTNLGVDSFRRHLADPTHVVICASDPHGRVRGYALLVDGTAADDDCAHLIRARPTVGISKFYLDAELHGSGNASRLLETIVQSATSRGAESLWLATNVNNTRARTFYERYGFVRRGTRVFLVGGRANDDVVYERPL